MKKIEIGIPEKLFKNLEERSKKTGLPKDKLVEIALKIYLNELELAHDRTLEENAGLKVAAEKMRAYLEKLEKDII